MFHQQFYAVLCPLCSSRARKKLDAFGLYIYCSLHWKRHKILENILTLMYINKTRNRNMSHQCIAESCFSKNTAYHTNSENGGFVVPQNLRSRL